MDETTLALCVRLCENGSNPEALAKVITELQRVRRERLHEAAAGQWLAAGQEGATALGCCGAVTSSGIGWNGFTRLLLRGNHCWAAGWQRGAQLPVAAAWDTADSDGSVGHISQCRQRGAELLVTAAFGTAVSDGSVWRSCKWWQRRAQLSVLAAWGARSCQWRQRAVQLSVGTQVKQFETEIWKSCFWSINST